MKWCEKTTPVAVELYEAKKAENHAEANSKEFLLSISKAVVEAIGHKGTPPTVNSIRAKLSAEKVYESIEKQAASRAGTRVASKDAIVGQIREQAGIEHLDIGTLSNANKADLEAVVEAITKLRVAVVQHAPKEVVTELLGDLEDSEINAIADGVTPSDLADAEDLAEEILADAEAMQAESADNLDENS